MGLLDTFLRLLGLKKSRSRGIATIVGDMRQEDPQAVEEVIDTEPQCLKLNHRRMTYRDKRLLPKPRPKRDSHGWPVYRKKKRIMPNDEASRLFSISLRANARNIRDLAVDEKQLQRYGLPLWRDEAELAAGLELSVKQLRHYSIHRLREKAPHYICYAIPKRNGERRLIHAPKRRLKAIQRRLNDSLVKRLPVSDAAHGFLAKHSIKTNAQQHLGKSVVIRMDLKDCFPTIHYGRVRGLLIAYGYSYPVAATLALLMTEAQRQRVQSGSEVFHVPVGPRVCVQGAPTSPGLCNAILLRLDRRLQGLTRKYNFTYTRYADDLTFSGDDLERVKPILTLVPRIVAEEGFEVNHAKTQIMRKGRRQTVTGVVVNKQPGLSRKERRRLRAEIHQLDANPTQNNERQRKRIGGRLAYLKMLNPAQAKPLIAAYQAKTSLNSR